MEFKESGSTYRAYTGVKRFSDLNLNQIPEEKRLEDLSFLQIAILEGKQAEANGGYYHPAANAAFDRLSNGCSSRIQYEALLANVSLAEKLTENSMETYPFV